MTLRGHVEKGAVVLDKPISFPDGTDVEIEVRAVTEAESDDGVPQRPKAASPLGEGLMKLAGTAVGLPQDMAAQHDHYLHGTPKK